MSQLITFNLCIKDTYLSGLTLCKNQSFKLNKGQLSLMDKVCYLDVSLLTKACAMSCNTTCIMVKRHVLSWQLSLARLECG